MPIRVQCVHCQSTISVAETLRGKTIRCPNCKEPTKVSGGPGANGQSPQSSKPTQTARPPAGKKTRVDGIRPGRPGDKAVRLPERDQDRKKTRLAAPFDDDDDREDSDDRPTRKPSRREDSRDERPSRRGKKKSGSGLMLLGIGAVLLVGLSALGYFVVLPMMKGTPAPQLAKDGGETKKEEDKKPDDKGKKATDDSRKTQALHYLPADSALVFGIDLKASGSSLYKNYVAKGMEAVVSQTDILSQVDRVVAGGNESDRPAVVLYMSKAQDLEKLRKTLNLKDREDKKNVYDADLGRVCYLPDSKTIVLLPDDSNLEKVLESTKPAVSSDLLEKIKSVHANPFWAVCSLKGEIGKSLTKMSTASLLDLDDVHGALGNAEFLSIHGTFLAKKLKLETRLHCASDAEARKADKSLNTHQGADEVAVVRGQGTQPRQGASE